AGKGVVQERAGRIQLGRARLRPGGPARPASLTVRPPRVIGMRVSNWARSHEFQPAAFHRPESLSELQRLVAGSARARALGSGHSFNDLADTPGALISLEGLPAEPSLTSDGVR